MTTLLVHHGQRFFLKASPGEVRLNITGIKIEDKKFPLKVPFVTALRRVDTIEGIHITITTDGGLEGHGAAAPTAPITGDTAASIKEAVAIIEKKIVGRAVDGLTTLSAAAAKAIVGNTSAKAAVDMALYDLFARKANLPLYAFLGGSRKPLSTDLTISLRDTAAMTADAVRAEANGMTALKIKLGQSVEDDFARIVSIRKAVKASLRVDANQGWSARDALRFMDTCAKAGIELDFLEQPVPRTDIEGLRFIKDRIPCPLVADESVFSPMDALKVAEARAADIVNVKLMKCGGISSALEIAAIAKTCGMGLMFGCMAESPIGISAVVHLASALENVAYLDADVPFLLDEIPTGFGFDCEGLTLVARDAPGM